jgi:ferric-dicitrate binding protein FerR (iron transport regulator)
MIPGSTERIDDLALLADLISGELGPAELDQVRDRLRIDESFRQLAEPVLAVMTVGSTASILSDAEATAALQARVATIDRERELLDELAGERRRRRWLAAPIMGFASVAMFFVSFVSAPTWRRFVAGVVNAPAGMVINTAVGEERSVPLRDGSRITAEPESRVIYSPALREKAQLVVLRGAATFDVVPQGFGAFRVAAGRVFVATQEAEFSIRAYADDSTVIVSVSHGRVLAAGPDQRALEVDSGSAVQVVAGHTGLETRTMLGGVTWDGGVLRFDRVPLATAARDVRRWYGTAIRLGDPGLAPRVVSTTLGGTERDAVEGLAAAAGATAEWTRDGVVFHDAMSRATRP